jgi:DNA polymerase-3 subunit delta
LGHIEVESRSQGLFGPQACYALVRNADGATPKQSEHLLQLAASVQPGNRLIICAADITWKKAMHKKMLAESLVVSSEFRMPSVEGFNAWFTDQVKQANLYVNHDAMAMIGERLCGLRVAAKQLIARMKLYDNDEGINFDSQFVGELLGERAPDDLESFCHAVAMKDVQSIVLLRHLLVNQQVSDVQLLTWLSMRMNQLLMYFWYQAKGERNPIQAARIFGEAKQKITTEAKHWTASELMTVMNDLTSAEKLLKGASIESRHIVLERLTLQLVSAT